MRITGIVFPLAGLLLGLLSVVLPATAQSIHGTIIGSVTDTTGAVVPGATIILTDTDKGVVRTTTASAIGDYRFLDAQADHYKVEVEAHGFETWSTTGLQLNTLQTLRVDVKAPHRPCIGNRARHGRKHRRDRDGDANGHFHFRRR